MTSKNVALGSKKQIYPLVTFIIFSLICVLVLDTQVLYHFC